ncbi:uncharacterized protein LOC117305243 [Asterias rubens]|uniref:uncharacterized protein LOC117305243 n=1 Tax=Asterias rubens TaxID=7604 RepID=UPI001455D67A|nr:uncharacterized protein LOC117305243 [Asterias rubens]
MYLLLVNTIVVVIAMEFTQGQQSIELLPHSTVLAGSNVTLVCTVQNVHNKTTSSVKWSRPNNPVNTTRALVSCTNETLEIAGPIVCNLTLESVEESSGGEYTCDGVVGGEHFTNSTELHVVPYPTIELQDACTGLEVGISETGPFCVPTTRSNLFNCTVYNITDTDGASTITWAINGDEVNVTSAMTPANGQYGLRDMRSSLYVASWADEYQDEVITVTCHFSGYMNIEPLEVTAQVKFYYDIPMSVLIGLASCHVAFAILAVIVVIVIVRFGDQTPLKFA